MNHGERLQKAVNYIEENLDRPISLSEVSKVAFSSLSYFHRVFYFKTGFTVKEYIRKRRLAKAAFQLHCTNLPIIQIGLSAAYETPETFTRAFKKEYGLAPRSFRQANQEYSLFNRLNILEEYAHQPQPKLDFDLDVESVFYKEARVQGFQIHTTLDNEQQVVDISHFAGQVFDGGLLKRHFDLKGSPIFGVYTGMTDESEFDYTIAALEVSCIKTSVELVSHLIPSSQYIKFTLNRMDRIKEAWCYIYGSWFLHSDQYRTPGFDFEIYTPDSVAIYIPMNGGVL